MKSFKSAIIVFVVCVVSVFPLSALAFYCLGSSLVVVNIPDKAEIIIVLGGGDGSRLRKAIGAYDEKLGDELLMVDKRKRHWDHIVNNQCKRDCIVEGKKVTYLVDSSNTTDDAKLTLEYCKKNQIKKVLIVTDPYHSRRAELIFSDILIPSGIIPIVIHSEDYGPYQPPGENFWPDWFTLRTVCLESLKIIHYKLTSIVKT